jgi:hypothetical protein
LLVKRSDEGFLSSAVFLLHLFYESRLNCNSMLLHPLVAVIVLYCNIVEKEKKELSSKFFLCDIIILLFKLNELLFMLMTL